MTQLSEYPQWMAKLLTIEQARQAAEAEKQRVLAEEKAAHERKLSVALVEALALVLDVALPPPPTAEIVLDGVEFTLGTCYTEPITERDEHGPTRWNFTLYVRPAGKTIQPIKPAMFTFTRGSLETTFHDEALRDLAQYVLRVHAQTRLYQAAWNRSIDQLVADMERADNVHAASIVRECASDYELSDTDYTIALLRLMLEYRAPESSVMAVTEFLLS